MHFRSSKDSSHSIAYVLQYRTSTAVRSFMPRTSRVSHHRKLKTNILSHSLFSRHCVLGYQYRNQSERQTTMMINPSCEQIVGKDLLDASRRPASSALDSMGQCQLSTGTKESDEIHRRRPVISFNSQKRSHSQIGTFDMTEIEEASKKVERSIAFPTIEWPAFEGDDDTEDSDETAPSPQAKRPRLGLVRSAPSFNLLALARAGSTDRFDASTDLC
jgi:hypothetical protein